MKTLLIATILFLFLMTDSFGGNDQGTITIKVSNIQVKEGAIHLAVYKDAETFLSDTFFLSKKAEVTNDGELIIVLDNVPFGEYAISFFHDENNNDKMDKYMGLIPKEPYGFSNNARGTMGPPSYDDAKFTLNKKEIEMVLTIEK